MPSTDLAIWLFGASLLPSRPGFHSSVGWSVRLGALFGAFVGSTDLLGLRQALGFPGVFFYEWGVAGGSYRSRPMRYARRAAGAPVFRRAGI